MKLTASFWPYVLTSAAQFERAKPHFLHEFQKKNHRSLWRWNRPRNHKSHLGSLLSKIDGGALKLSLITNRGVKVYPDGMKETFCTDHWRCRFKVEEGKTISHAQVIDLLQKADLLGLDFIKTEHLYTFDGVTGYSLGQGD